MNKTILAAGVAITLLLCTGFEGVDKTAETNTLVPKEKKELLNRIAGRWITQTNIYARNGEPASKVIGSDVWQWSPDGNFLLHTAYGIRNNNGFGGMEITGYNPKTGDFDSYIFNPDGTFSTGTLTISKDKWTWNTKGVRTSGTFDKDGKILTVIHEMTTDGKTWEVFMDGVLTKGSDF